MSASAKKYGLLQSYLSQMPHDNKENQQSYSNRRGYNFERSASLEKPKRYDYLSKYSQHHILEKAYEQNYAETMKDHPFLSDILIVERRSNSSKSHSSGKFKNKRQSPNNGRICDRSVENRRSSNSQGRSFSKSNKNIKPYINLRDSKPLTLIGSQPVSPSRRQETTNEYKSVLSVIPSLSKGLSV